MRRFLLPVFIILLLDVYGFIALRPLFEHKSNGARIAFTVIWWSIPVLTLLYFALVAYDIEPSLPRALTVPFRALLFIAYLAKFLGSIFFLIDDLRRIAQGLFHRVWRPGDMVFWPDRSRFLTQVAMLAGGLPAAMLTYGIVRNPHRYQVHKIDVPIKGLSPKHAGLKLVQISDIHSGSFYRTEPVREGIRLINELEPDLVAFTGDLVNSQATEIEPFLEVFKDIKARHGVFSVIGNHDYGDYVAGWGPSEKEANWQRLYANHRALGWNLLLNENAILDINGDPLAMIGVENWSVLDRFPRTGDLAKAVLGAESVPTKILLSHDPTHWDAQVRPNHADIALTLSGHTHGFQFGVEIPGFRWSPSQYIYKQWAGLYTEGDQHLYVNRGFGFLGYPGRVGILPEITLLTLVPA